MKRKYLILMAIAASVQLARPSTSSAALVRVLGSAESFAVLGGSTVTNTHTATTITGNLGVSPGLAVTGFPPGIVNAPSTIYSGDAVAAQAQIDLTKAYIGLAAMPLPVDLSGQDLGGKTLVSGVYHFNTSAQLTGNLYLNAEGNNNAYWVFQIGSTLTTASASAVFLTNPGTNNGSDDGLYWQVGSSATLGTGTAFEGNILALTSITLNSGASINNGRALARNGAVTLDNNVVSNVCPPANNNGPGFSGGLEFVNDQLVQTVAQAVPEPSALLLLGGCGLVGLLVNRPRRRSAL